jgi:hypothetical protein
MDKPPVKGPNRFFDLFKKHQSRVHIYPNLTPTVLSVLGSLPHPTVLSVLGSFFGKEEEEEEEERTAQH